MWRDRINEKIGKIKRFEWNGDIDYTDITVRRLYKCIKSFLGVYEVFLCMETANGEVLQRAGHVSTIGQVLSALDRLEKANISICLPFLFGLPDKTINSLGETADFATKLVNKYSNIRMVLISLAIPLIGFAWFDRLRSV